MRVQCYRNGVRVTAKLFGELDHHSAAYTRASLERCLEDPEVKSLVLDLSGCGFMDSSGIGVILGRYKKASALGIAMGVAGENPQVSRVLRIGGIYSLLGGKADDI